ncbi:MAG: cytochrome c maturation protein CcmE [Acidobacteria bacterium]|nr:cytochrome c maturation protein CcmE [Acidobacteriota bacterium]MCB9377768.1 cytochrome c maturation protein CcmE [Holophagales bacterium]
MKRRAWYLFGALLLAAFAGYSFTSFRQHLTPYVSYHEARGGMRTVQVAGGLEAGSSSYDAGASALRFTLKDPQSGETLRVRYDGLKPANFEDAISIVAIGRFDSGNQEFQASKLLVKCPSKYQGAEVKEYGA